MISKVLISKYKRKPKQSHYSFRTFCFFDSTLYFSYVSSSFLLISISTLLLHKCSFARSIFPDFIVVDNSADASLIAFSVTTIPLFKISLSAVYFTSLSCSLCLEEDSFFLSLNSSQLPPVLSFDLLNMQHIDYVHKKKISRVLL